MGFNNIKSNIGNHARRIQPAVCGNGERADFAYRFANCHLDPERTRNAFKFGTLYGTLDG